MMRNARRTSRNHSVLMRALSTAVACLTAIAPLSAGEAVRRIAAPPEAVAEPGAAVAYVEGEARGDTPAGMRYRAAVGNAPTAIPGGSPANSRLWTLLNAEADGSLRLKIPVTAYGAIQPRPSSRRAGSLRVVTEPSGATVYVDDREVGRSPVDITDLTPGEHEVRVVRSGYSTRTRDVTLGVDDETLRVTLERRVAESNGGGGGPGVWGVIGTLAALGALGYLLEKAGEDE